MAIDQESFNKRLYDIFKTRGYKPAPKDSKNERTNPETADVFEFQFSKDGEDYGKAWATIDKTSSLNIYYDDKQAGSPPGQTKGVDYDDSWSGLLKHLKQWALSKQLNFGLHDSDRLGDDMRQRDYYKMKEKMNEGYHAVNKTTSYNDNIPNVKVVIQHDKQIGEGEQRWRNVHKIFVENTEGERFAVPTRMPGIARVYGRHVAEGGTPYDERGKHITTLVEEYTKMAGFVRATRRGEFNESVAKLIAEGVQHHKSLKETLQKMQSHRGYNHYFESWTPALMEDESDHTSIAEMFAQESIDPRIESVLPILNKLNSNIINEIEEVNELDQWAKSITEMVQIDENEDYEYEKDLAMEFVKLPLASMSMEEIRSEMSDIFKTLYEMGMGDEPQTDVGVAMEELATSVEDSGEYFNDDWVYPSTNHYPDYHDEISDEDLRKISKHQQIVNGLLLGSKPGELEEGKRDTHCSAKCCGADVKAADCGCPADCPHCNCNAKLDEGVVDTVVGKAAEKIASNPEVQKQISGMASTAGKSAGDAAVSQVNKAIPGAVNTATDLAIDNLKGPAMKAGAAVAGATGLAAYGGTKIANKQDAEKEMTTESVFNKLVVDAMEMSEKEFAKKHPEMAHRYDDILAASSKEDLKDKLNKPKQGELDLTMQGELDLNESYMRSVIQEISVQARPVGVDTGALEQEMEQWVGTKRAEVGGDSKQLIRAIKSKMMDLQNERKRSPYADEAKELDMKKRILQKYLRINMSPASSAMDAADKEARDKTNPANQNRLSPSNKDKVTIGRALSGIIPTLFSEERTDEFMRKDFDDDKPNRPKKGKLVTKDGQEVVLPLRTQDFRGDEMIVTGYKAPHKYGSTGRIYTDDGMSYFPGVADLKIIDHDFSDDIDEALTGNLAGSIAGAKLGAVGGIPGQLAGGIIGGIIGDKAQDKIDDFGKDDKELNEIKKLADLGSEDDDLADEESGKNHDPKTGKRTKPHPFDPEDEHLQEELIDETDFSDKEIRMAYGILNDPRYKGGNMAGAIKAIEGIASGLSEHPGVQKAIYKTQNEPDNLEESIRVGKRGFYVNVDPRTGEETPLTFSQFQSTWYDEFKDDPESRNINTNKLSLKYQVYLDQLGDNLLEIERGLARQHLESKIEDKIQEFIDDIKDAKRHRAEIEKEEIYKQANEHDKYEMLWDVNGTDGNIKDMEDMLIFFKAVLADHQKNGTTHWWQSFNHGDYLDTAIRDDIAGHLSHMGAWKGDLREGLDANQKRAGQLGPVGGPAKVGDLVGAESKHANDEMSVSQMSDEDLADYLNVDVKDVKADRDHAEEVANDKSADHAPDNMLEDILRLSGYDQYKGKSTAKGAGTPYKG